MTATIRLPGRLLHAVREDLMRPHEFALERVGWIFAREAREARGELLLAFDYSGVADEHYIDDRTVGARINSAAIRRALERALRSGDCVLHVHAHAHVGPPGFSPDDTEGLRELMPSFGAVAPHAIHGAVVLSDDRAAGRVWLPPSRDPNPARVVLVSPGLTICGGEP
jgi:hypothetical protein